MAYLSLPYGKFSSLSDLHYQCKLLCRGRGQQLLLGSLKLQATSSCLCWAILSITIVDEIFVSSFMGSSLIVGNFSYTASHASWKMKHHWLMGSHYNAFVVVIYTIIGHLLWKSFFGRLSVVAVHSSFELEFHYEPSWLLFEWFF